MPVWHEETRELVAAGRLRVVGLTQEQHPDRCQLYAQWMGYDFPILWDPFNLTESAAVPMVMGVDGSGIVRSLRLDVRKGAAGLEEVLDQIWPAQVLEPARPYPGVSLAAAGRLGSPRSLPVGAQHGIAQLLFHRNLHGSGPTAEVFEASLAKLGSYGRMPNGPGAASFHLGVAYRLRYDSPHREASDFQASLDAWMTALFKDPGQYIWRRRIQQWGPRLDKPYPFYDWVPKALADLTSRGEVPIVVRVPLSGAEVAGGTQEIPRREQEDAHPDPGGKLPRDTGGLVALETAAALHTGVTSKRVREPAGTARVHVILRPDSERGVHWGNEAGPARVWIDAPEGWDMRRSLWTLPLPGDEPESAEVRILDFELRPPLGPPQQTTLHGVAIYPVCEGQTGSCALLAQEFSIELPLPVPPEQPDSEKKD